MLDASKHGNYVLKDNFEQMLIKEGDYFPKQNGKSDLTLIGLSNRHVRLTLSYRRGYEVGPFSWRVGVDLFFQRSLNNLNHP